MDCLTMIRSRRLAVLALLAFAPLIFGGCKGISIKVEPQAVDVKADLEPNSVGHVEASGTVQPGAVQNRIASKAFNAEIHRGALAIARFIDARLQKGALQANLEKGSVTFNIPLEITESGNIQVPEGAVQVAKDAVNINLTVNLQPYSIVTNVRGAEVQSGAFAQSPWTVLILAITATAGVIFFFVLRQRNREHARALGKEAHWFLGG